MTRPATAARAERVKRLREWLKSPNAGWLRENLRDVQEGTREMYPDEELDERFCIVEHLALPDDHQTIVSTFASEEDAARRVADLFFAAEDSSWHPVAVLDLDTGAELTIRLAVTFERVPA